MGFWKDSFPIKARRTEKAIIYPPIRVMESQADRMLSSRASAKGRGWLEEFGDKKMSLAGAEVLQRDFVCVKVL